VTSLSEPVEVEDDVGPGWARAALNTIGGVMLFLGLRATTFGWEICALAMATLLAGSPALGRLRPRNGTLTISPGHLRIRAGLLSRSIRPKQIVGASASGLPNGKVGVAFYLRRAGYAPLTLTVENEAVAARVLEALGIGYDGKGLLPWPTAPARWTIARTCVRVALALAWLGTIVAGGGQLGYRPLLLLSFLALLLPEAGVTSAITLQPGGVLIRAFRDAWWTRSIGYAEIRRVVTYQRSAHETIVHLELHVGEPIDIPVRTVQHVGSGLSRTQLQHLIAQLESAVARAHGNVKPRPELSMFVDRLKRGAETVETWMARVESTAAQVVTRERGSGGYRTADVVSANELWAILQSPDADPFARAAAGRILSRVEPEALRVRIGDVLKTIPSEDERERIRIGLESSAEDAARELERLETPAEQTNALRRHLPR